DRVAHELHAGLARTDQLSVDPLDSGLFEPRAGDRVGFAFPDAARPEGQQNDTQRLQAGYQVEAQVGARHLATLGADLEHETGEIGSRAEPLLSPERTNIGVYAQDRVA